MSDEKEPPITLVVRRGALRRYHRLKRDTANLPVVVTWDRRSDDESRGASGGTSDAGPPEDRRRQPSFTWELADFIVVPGDAAGDEPAGTGDSDAGNAAEASDDVEPPSGE